MNRFITIKPIINSGKRSNFNLKPMKYFVPLVAQDIGATADLSAEIAQGLFTTNNVWMMLSTALVFIMHLGFAGVETGFGQAKNTVNILFKNTITPILGIMTYAMVWI